jgi:hypothetical protein
VPPFDVPDGAEVVIGWLQENVEKLSMSRDDGRFVR